MVMKYFPSPAFFFKYFDKHPYVSHQGEEIKLPLSKELKGLDTMNLGDKKDYIVKVSDDETKLELSNIIDGGEFY